MAVYQGPITQSGNTRVEVVCYTRAVLSTVHVLAGPLLGHADPDRCSHRAAALPDHPSGLPVS